tara:strand:+ start:842 stop:1681 length:840 start_codon:yes stop_codon:yes gene_type:complete
MKDNQIQRFFDWINQRTEIQIKKDRGDPWPWTEDKIFQEFKFTNAFRENDKTTIWFREHIRDPLKYEEEVFMATVIFRWFNLIETGETLLKHDLHIEWDPEKAFQVILPQKKWITGAYMIKSPTGKNKIRGICETITIIWCDRFRFLDKCPWGSLEQMWERLLGYPFLGPFLAYELVTDLRHTYIGGLAQDIDTWANAGPGAMRGLNRIHDRPLKFTSKKHDWCAEMRELLDLAVKYTTFSRPAFELRDIEHSLCEFDKYERVRLGQGQPRSKYTWEGK